MKVFVTVGTGNFDDLVRAVDNLKLKNCLIQIGNGKYTPKNCKYFRFKDSIKNDIDKADLVITHAGAGTLFELLNKNKKVIAVANLNIIDSHQLDLVKKLSKKEYILRCNNLPEIESQIEESKKFKQKKYRKDSFRLIEKIKELI